MTGAMSAITSHPAVTAAASSAGMSRDEVAREARATIERIAWEVVPDLAETIIREEIGRILRERGA